MKNIGCGCILEWEHTADVSILKWEHTADVSILEWVLHTADVSILEWVLPLLTRDNGLSWEIFLSVGVVRMLG